MRKLSFFALLLCGITLSPGRAISQRTYLEFKPSQSNKHRIFLSPARHSDAGRRGECSGANENNLSLTAAYHVARSQSGIGTEIGSLTRSLVDRGYIVRIGIGTIRSAIDDSKVWGADLHVVLHTNANSGSVNCGRLDHSSFGTMVIYRANSPQSERLSRIIKEHLGPSSPGRHDFVCRNPGDPCTRINSLGELREPSAIPTYIELEFHSWDAGTVWLNQSHTWAWRIAAAIDEYLGYPTSTR